MSTLLLNTRTAWEDFFSVTNPTKFNSITYTSRQTPSGTSVYVSNCLFNSITYKSGNGGALYSTSVTYLLIESSSFFSCRASGSGGAIYFTNSGGQCVLHEVCGFDCCSTSTSYGQFAYITVKNDVSSKNYINYSSFTRCVNEIGGYRVLDLYYGKIYCPSVNSSMNKCSGRSGIICQPFCDSNSVTGLLSYCSFTDNNNTVYSCVVLWTSGAKLEIKNCNIIRNIQGNLGIEGTISTNGNLKIEGSCILENIATYIFYQGSSSYTVTISNCTVDKFSSNRNIITQNTVTKSFILALNHMSTRNCNSNYDFIGTLTPIIIQSSACSNKQIPCSCAKFFYQPRPIETFSLISLFIFTFIPPFDSSNYW
jgi:hypothetical protein